MAIRIDIPGVGNVSVEGAAEERTMREILQAIEERNKAEGIQTKEVNEGLKEFRNGLKDTTKEVDGLGKAADSTSKGLSGFGKSLAATAATIAVSFIKAYDTMAEKPIQAGAALMQAAIDLTAQLTKLGIDAVAKVGTAAAAILGPWAGGVQSATNAVSKFGKDIVDLGAQIATVGNQLLAAEFEKRVKALSDFTRAGASFTGGMSEIGKLAQESGIGLANYSKAIANSRESITAMGLSAGEAAKLVAKGFKGLTGTAGASGAMLREELLALGYSYEEQGEVMALFMAQQRRAGVALENLAPAELARGTAEYAKNLKVLSDITGQDAKKLIERAQVESMRGALAGKLNDQQNKAFQGVFTGLAKIGPEMAPKLQLALTQLLAGKAVRDPAIAGNKVIMDMLMKSAQTVRDGQLDTENAFTQTYDNLIVAGKEIKASGQDMADVANVFGVTGIAADMANLNNAFRVMQGEVGEATKSFTAAKGQQEATDDLTKGYQRSTKALTDFQNTMEDMATKALPTYADVISKNTERMAKIMGIAIDYLTGKIPDLESLGTAIYNETGLPQGTGNLAEAQRTREMQSKAAEQQLSETYKKQGYGDITGALFASGDEVAAARKKADQASEAENKFKQARVEYELGLSQVKNRLQKQADEAKYGWQGAFGIKGGAKIDPAKLKAEIEEYNKNFATMENALDPAASAKRKEYARILGMTSETGFAPGNVDKATPKGKAKGGISEGPISGYSETLHGREAVIPLPDNRGIPVQLDTGGINTQLAQQSNILTDILTAMKENNKYTSGILQQGY